MEIPFVDLKIQYDSIKSEIDLAIQNVINESAFIKGKYVKKFEDDYAEAYSTKNVISCANGTDALYIYEIKFHEDLISRFFQNFIFMRI